MDRKKGVAILSAFLIWGLMLSPALAQTSQLVVVATKATFGAAQQWVDLLTKEGVEVKNVEPSQFEADKNAPYIVLMGGMDEAGGIMDLAKKVAGEQAAQLSEPTGKMLVKSNVWAQGQQVLVFTGSDRAACEKIRKETREKWLDLIAEWLDLEITVSKMNAY